MVHGKKYHATSTALTRSIEFHCQQGVEDLVRQIRMDSLVSENLGPLSTDLFVSKLSAQLPSFISWKPDPLAIATDAFTVDWSNIPEKPYANPPWQWRIQGVSLVSTETPFKFGIMH